MKQRTVKILFLLGAIFLVALAFPAAALADGGEGGSELSKIVNGYLITLVFQEPVAVGENQFHVQVIDSHNMPVSNAHVEVSLVQAESGHSEPETSTSSHNAMPGMDMGGGSEHSPAPSADMGDAEQHTEASSAPHTEMETIELEAGHESGEYAGEIAIAAAGEWIVRVHLATHDEQVEIDFPVTITQPSLPGVGIITGFFAVNAGILIAAVILRPKPATVALSNKG